MVKTTILAHVGALGQHDMWVIVPMAILSIAIMVVLAKPKAPPADETDTSDTPDKTT